MIDITYAILSMNVHFDKKQVNILCKIPSDSNAHNITLYCEFSKAVVGHDIPTLPGMNEKTQSYIFIPPPNEVWGGVYWIHLVRLSVCLSVDDMVSGA